MPKIIYLDPSCPHYRVDIYNFFAKEFSLRGYQFDVYYDLDEATIKKNSPYIHGIKYNFLTLIKLLESKKPDILITIVGLKYKFIFPFLFYLKVKGSKILVRAHGINLSLNKSFLIQWPYHLRNFIADRVILYSAHERKFIYKSSKKIFYANNTLNYNSFFTPNEDKNVLKMRYGLHFDKIVLFCGRIIPRKRLDILLDAFSDCTKIPNNYGLIIVGGGMPPNQVKVAQTSSNIIYFDSVFDKVKLGEIFSMADLFCIPGWSGLSINHAFFYGLPYITTNCQHAPEICYVQDGLNGRIINSNEPKKLREAIVDLFEKPSELKRMSVNARKTLYNEASIEGMFEGYYQAVLSVLKS
jgi:glycosyltransferase involved in cell wall biosynthesis